MKCRVCGAELKKDGELCNNCLNRLQQEEAIRGDKTPVYGFKSTFILGYELLRHCEQIGIVIFMIALILSVDLSYWKYAVIIGCAFAIFGILYLFYDKFSHPCLLISDSFEEVKEQLKISVKVLLDDPLYIFAFRVCYLLCEYLKEYLKNKFGSYFITDINKGEVQEFWQKVQWLLLTRKAWRNEKFYSEVCDIYDEIANVWGEFLPFE